MSRREEVAKRDEELLAQLGYKQEFKREFTPLEVFGVAFNVIGLFPSLASVLVYAIPNGGPVAMVWGWAVASVFILCIGLSIAELASAAPTAGGVYFWTHSFASPRWRNLLCWVVGYVNTVGYIAGLASVDWSCAIQITAAASVGSGQTYIATNAQTYGIYVAILLSHALLCCLATSVLARMQRIYTTINICLCFAVIVGLPIATPKQYMNTARFALGSFDNLYGWPDGFAFVLSLLTPLWTVSAFDASVHISEEASNAATAVPWAIVCSNIIATLLGWAINVTLTFCMGTDMGYLLSSPIGQPMAQIFFSSFGQNGTLVLWAFVVIAQYMMGSSCLLVASRQIFAYSRDRALPLSGILCRVNKSASAPVNAVWFAVICAILLGLLAFAGTQAISAIFPLAINALYTAYSITIAARWLGNSNFRRGPFHLGILSLPISIIAVLFMAFMSIIFLFPIMPGPSATTMNYTVVVLGGILGLSLVWYYLPMYGGIHWFVGPVPNIGKRDGDNPYFVTQDESREKSTIKA
ncbi:amino acid/polyamine transporter I [Pisolithus croceorrhizus]|nr:amino acid/polyamine transporter I [Pisolithus croceorrhizus]KAI6135073.1 amino acid/polyamine transporter I [Pisolithus croceorrhizus]